MIDLLPMPKAKSSSNKSAKMSNRNILITVPSWMTEVTPASKALAMGLFIALPFISFYLGARLQRELMGVYPPFEVVVRQGCSAPMEYKRGVGTKEVLPGVQLDDSIQFKQQ
jgi:hypothetical protein